MSTDEFKMIPRTNPDLKGHGEAERILLDAWASEKLHHAWLITGPEGIGKATLAWRFARFALNGDGGAGAGLFGDGPDNMDTPSDSSIFKRMAAGGHPDFLCLEKGMVNPKTHKISENDIPVAIARDATKFVRLTPAESDWRVIIVDAADNLNRNAANALLKALEEPPARALFLLVSHAPGRLLPTIRSRCRRLNLHTLKDDLVIDLLGERYPDLAVPEKSALATLSEGSIGKAISLYDAGGIDLYRGMMKLMENADKMDVTLVHTFAGQLSGKSSEASFYTFRTLLDWWFKRLIRTIATGDVPVEVIAHENSLIDRLKTRGNLALWLEVWEKMTKLLAQADAPANLDKKQVVIGAFMTLETAMAKA